MDWRRTRAARLLVGFAFFYLLTIVYCRSTTFRDPTSAFFDARRAHVTRYSALRLREAEAYMADLELGGKIEKIEASPGEQQHHPLLCLGIATVARRGHHQYVRSTVGSLFAGLTEDERKMIFFNFFIAQADPSTHPVYGEKWLDTLPDRLLEYPHGGGSDRDQIRVWEEGGWYRNKSIYDYKYLLRDCYETTDAAYVAIVEDDTLAVGDWFRRLLDALQVVQDRMDKQLPGQSWIYLRLFYTESLLGWNSEDWPTYLFWSFVVWSSISSAMLVVNRRPSWKVEFLTTGVMGVVSLVCVPALIVLFFLAGKQSTMPIAPGVQMMNKYGCCSQGFVYPRAVVPLVTDQVRLETKGLVDMQIEKVANQNRYMRWAIVPPLLQHIGATSSKGYGFDDNARQIWNFRYESYSDE
ncbi:hypothetical protein LTS17_007498 [Exophiala oligosperma]